MASYSLVASASCDYTNGYPGGVINASFYSDDSDGSGALQPNRYYIYDGKTARFQGSLPFTGLANGRYTIEAVYAADGQAEQGLAQSEPITVNCLSSPLSLDYVATTPATATGGGTITVRASGGTSPLSAAISLFGMRQQLVPNAQGLLETTFVNIPAGTYPGSIADSSNPPQTVSFTATVDPYVVAPVYGCTDPSADNYDPSATVDDDSCTYTPPVRLAYFEVPPMQSLRFVQPGRTDRPAFDNTLLADEDPLDYTNPGYCQKVEQGDTLVLQVLSNYVLAPVFELRRTDTNAVVTSIAATRVQQGAGRTVSFEVYLKPDTTAGRTRVYFNEDALPLPFLSGQRITIDGTGTSLDKTYPIQDVLEDASAAVPYLTVIGTYPSGALRLDGSITTTYVVQAYDTYQVVVPFAAIAMGCYYARITAADPDFEPALAVSEPIDVAAVHPYTKVVLYRNFDNAFGLNYSAGLVNRQRVVGRFFDRKPATEKVVLRNDDSELILLSASVYRKVTLEALLLPGWLHEVLAVAFSHDFVRVDDVQVVLEADYTYEPVERYTQGKGTALLEIAKFLGAGNRDDLGDVDAGGGPFLVANDKYIIGHP